jgi:hypothetical protein
MELDGGANGVGWRWLGVVLHWVRLAGRVDPQALKVKVEPRPRGSKGEVWGRGGSERDEVQYTNDGM